MKISKIVVFIFIISAVLIIFGCSNPETNSSENLNSDNSETVVEDDVDLNDPVVLAQEIGENYQNAISELFDILEGNPEVEVLRPKVESLKEKYVDIFFEFGAYHEKMNEVDRAKVSSILISFMYGLDMEKLDSIFILINYYRPMDNELANEISSFNIITQYSFYDLLIKQEPEEAKRLGILED